MAGMCIHIYQRVLDSVCSPFVRQANNSCLSATSSRIWNYDISTCMIKMRKEIHFGRWECIETTHIQPTHQLQCMKLYNPGNPFFLWLPTAKTCTEAFGARDQMSTCTTSSDHVIFMRYHISPHWNKLPQTYSVFHTAFSCCSLL